MYCELKSRFRYSRFRTFLHELKSIFALLVLLIDIPLSLSLDYHSQMYSESVGGLALLPHDP